MGKSVRHSSNMVTEKNNQRMARILEILLLSQRKPQQNLFLEGVQGYLSVWLFVTYGEQRIWIIWLALVISEQVLCLGPQNF